MIIIIRTHSCNSWMWPIATDGVAWCVCLSVCLSVSGLSHCKLSVGYNSRMFLAVLYQPTVCAVWLWWWCVNTGLTTCQPPDLSQQTTLVQILTMSVDRVCHFIVVHSLVSLNTQSDHHNHHYYHYYYSSTAWSAVTGSLSFHWHNSDNIHCFCTKFPLICFRYCSVTFVYDVLLLCSSYIGVT